MRGVMQRGRAGLGVLLAGLGTVAGCDSTPAGASRGEPVTLSKEEFEKYANPVKNQKKAPDPNAPLMRKYANPNGK